MRTVAPLLLLACTAAPAVAGDVAPTVLAVPTAWTQPATAVHVTADADHRGGSGARVTLSYARLVDVDVAGDGLVTACDPCGGPDHAGRAVQQATAGWKLALRPWRGGAVAVGVRVPFVARDGGRAAMIYGVTSVRFGGVRLHVGASAWASEHRAADGAVIHRRAQDGVRPLAGLEWTPDIYPRTTVVADVQWLPRLAPTAADTRPAWAFGWGVRYQALAWGGIELGVHHRADEGLGDATVMVRLSAIAAASPR